MKMYKEQALLTVASILCHLKGQVKGRSIAAVAAIALAGATMLASTAAQAQEAQTEELQASYAAQPVCDPLETVNRGIFQFNRGVDIVLVRPVTTAYRTVVPEFGRDRVSNFLDNLGEPVTVVNSILQGDPERAFTSFWRFILNSTFGAAGLFDFAGHHGLKEREEDFGQTLGVYGVGSCPYLVLPLLGPSNLRDLVGRVADNFTDPYNSLVESEWRIARAGVTVIDARSRNYELIDELMDSSIDPYASFRSLYQQRRAAQITNNPAPRPVAPPSL